ncbi:MAG: copper amine oxidase N-terminal domain-containing protein [Clostridiales bacterium]|nr:copper amine oxidase N-terminal domain-containing protein [Clostridiales bacterium]MCF8021604.1 copper amine oxidase N-terminal domain-containing protein [Clostridiales bacterium]
MPAHSEERKASVFLDGKIVDVWIGENKAQVNGTVKFIDAYNPDVVPIIYHNRTMLPLQFVAESLGCDVGWDSALQEVTVTYPSN